MDLAPSAPAPRAGRLALLLFTGLAAWLAWRTLRPPPAPLHDPGAQPRAVTARGELAEFERATIEVYRNASPSVVHIANVALRRDRWTLDVLAIPQGTGSGFVWDERGYVVTNAHVVRGGDRFEVTLADRTTWPATLVGLEADKDVAVLKVEGARPGQLRPLAIGTSHDLVVGQTVLAIGNPFGLDQTLTTGVISGLGREITAQTGRRISDVIQTDAAINPGNSGGPLLDSAGRLVGMNTAIYSPTGASAGIGFAVPVDTINRVVPRIIRGEPAARAGFGITLLPDRYRPELGVSRGVVVLDVLPGSAAERAGFRPLRRDPGTGRLLRGDAIVALDGAPVEGLDDLLDRLEGRAPGEEVTVTLERGGTRRDVRVALQALGGR